ncbi:MAG: MFS transporter [Rhodospirillales bacterium CG15_BIG_FIL_POST_REV_8_21_14_020_66_15]|nr:MAG: MFS transporter [Rhodospirillales bacterium CG15_BIG_FIL_POST_REV_8_21_14_020_66_15]
MSIAARLAPSDNLSEAEVETGLNWLLRNGIWAQGMETLALGPILVAYALYFEASNLAIGLLAALPNLGQLALLPAVQIVEKVRRRRFLAVAFGAASRPMLLLMATAVLMPTKEAGLAVLLTGLTLRYTLGAFVGCSFNSWIRDLVPEHRMGAFFASRLMWMTGIGMTVSLLAGLFVDEWGRLMPHRDAEGYSILLVLAFLAGCASVYCMCRIPEPAMPPAERHLPLTERLAQPFKDVNFRNLVIFLGAWNFAINLAAPFFTVYLYKRLGLSVTMVTVLLIVSQAANIAVLKTWGRIADNFSNKGVLTVAAPLFVLSIFLWTFTTLPEKHALTMPLLIVIHVLTGISTAGVTLASGNIGLKLAPRGAAASYLSVSSLVTAICAGTAPIFGGLFADWFAGRELTLILRWTDPETRHLFQAINLRHWDFFFGLAAVLGLLSLQFLRQVREVGEVEEEIVLEELMATARQGMRNLTSVAGLRAAATYPVELLFRKVHLRRRRDGEGSSARFTSNGPMP